MIPKDMSVNEASKLREDVNLLMEKGDRNFDFDFSDCNFIDSTGLGVLVSVYKRCIEVKGEIKLLNMNNNVMKVFKLTRLDQVFTIR